MAQNKYTIHFYISRDYFLDALKRGLLSPFSIILYPHSIKKNTKNKSIFDFVVLDKNAQQCYYGACKLGFLNESQKVETQREKSGRISQFWYDSSKKFVPENSLSIFKKFFINGNEYVSIESFSGFVTILNEIEDYRNLLQKMGAQETIDILHALHDVTIQKTLPENSSWYSIFKEDFVEESFISSRQEMYSLYEAGGLIKDGLNNEKLNSKLPVFNLEFQLKPFKNPHQIQFLFSSEKNKEIECPINILIGKNGLGKSQTLRKIVDYFSNRRSDVIVNVPDNQEVLLNRLLVVDNSMTHHAQFPETIANKFYLDYRKISLWNDERPNLDSMISDILDLCFSDRVIGGINRRDIFYKAVEKICPREQLCLPFEEKGKNQIDYCPIAKIEQKKFGTHFPVYKKRGKRLVPLRIVDGKRLDFSSGQLNFLRLAAWLCINVENGSLVLMDEPDIYLHPSYVTHFINLLYSILNSTGARAIVATHSAYVVREVPKQQVKVFQEQDNKINIGMPFMNTVGADVGEISFFIFEESYYGDYIEQTKDQLKGLDKDSRKIRFDELCESLSLPAKIYLKREIGL